MPDLLKVSCPRLKPVGFQRLERLYAYLSSSAGLRAHIPHRAHYPMGYIYADV